jgi:hypothetical protein
MARRGKNPFAGMGRESLLEYCRALYQRDGVAVFYFEALNAIPGLYMSLYRCGLTQDKLLKHFGVSAEYEAFKRTTWRRKIGDSIQLGWTWERVLTDARKVVATQGFLPPAAWFFANGHGSLVSSVYRLDKTWADLRTECDSFAGSDFVQSRNGMRWRSHPEASLSNFLHARGIEHARGRKYPDDYGQQFGYSYGYYDLAFKASNGKWIDVEVWGDKPNGHSADRYAKKRSDKEEFNRNNTNFLGIHHTDCFTESRLIEILAVFIGHIEPFVFDGPHDAKLQSTHWSNADELLETCRMMIQTEWGGQFPNEEWLRKRGKFKNRPGPAYNTISIYIRKWLGGIRKARKLLGRNDESTETWDRDKALTAYMEFWQKWRQTPGRLKKRVDRGQQQVTSGEYSAAAMVAHATRKYVGDTMTIHKLLQLPLPRKSPRRKT